MEKVRKKLRSGVQEVAQLEKTAIFIIVFFKSQSTLKTGCFLSKKSPKNNPPSGTEKSR